MKTHGPPVYERFRLKRRRALHLTAKAKLSIFGRACNAGLAGVQAGQDFLNIVANRADNAHACDDDAGHSNLRLSHALRRRPLPPR